MGLFATGVTVMAAHGEHGTQGMTANAVMSVSLDPPLVCVAVNRSARMVDVLRGAGAFVLNVLAEDQQPLARYFAGAWPHPSPPEHRFEGWAGGPRLVGCLAAIGCRIERMLDGGDHELVLGRVLALHRADGPFRPLLFFGGRYHRLAEPSTAPRDPVVVWNPEEVRIYYDS